MFDERLTLGTPAAHKSNESAVSSLVLKSQSHRGLVLTSCMDGREKASATCGGSGRLRDEPRTDQSTCHNDVPKLTTT